MGDRRYIFNWKSTSCKKSVTHLLPMSKSMMDVKTIESTSPGCIRSTPDIGDKVGVFFD